MISIILPVYNAASSLDACIQSVLCQTCPDFELLVIDDGSTDGSSSIIRKYESRDSRIRCIRQENQGVAAARNTGLSAAVGTYVTFIDSDDRYTPDFLSRMLSAAEHHHADLVICGYTKITGNHSCNFSVPRAFYENKDAFLTDFIPLYEKSYLQVPWNKFYRVSSIRHPFPIGLSLGEDMIFNLKNMADCAGIAILPDCLYHYHCTPILSLSTSWHDNLYDICRSMKQEVETFAGSSWCARHEDFLINRLWDDYFRCLLRMFPEKRLTIPEKKELFLRWEKEDNVRYLKRNIKRIHRFYKYLFQVDSFWLWYIAFWRWGKIAGARNRIRGFRS